MKPLNVGGKLRKLGSNKAALFAVFLGEAPGEAEDGTSNDETEDLVEYIAVPKSIAREAIEAAKEAGVEKMAAYIDPDGDLIIGEFDPDEPEEESAAEAAEEEAPTSTKEKVNLEYRIRVDGEQAWKGSTEDAMMQAYDDMGGDEDDDEDENKQKLQMQFRKVGETEWRDWE